MGSGTDRNAPCRCGSGKKYKKCHGAPQTVARRQRPESDGQPRQETHSRNGLADQIQAFLATPGREPGCYDDAGFSGFETAAPDGSIAEYARFVMTRARSSQEDERTRRIVYRLAELLDDTTKDEDLLGKCANVCAAIVRILESQGVWAFMVEGSTRFTFDPATGIGPKSFYKFDVADQPGAFLGHAWVVAPPFHIIDFTARAQRWQDGEAKYLPRFVVSEKATPTAPIASLFFSPEVMPCPRPGHAELLAWLPTRLVQEQKVAVAYQPDKATAPADKLDAIRFFEIGGQPVGMFAKTVAEPLLKAAAAA